MRNLVSKNIFKRHRVIEILYSWLQLTRYVRMEKLTSRTSSSSEQRRCDSPRKKWGDFRCSLGDPWFPPLSEPPPIEEWLVLKINLGELKKAVKVNVKITGRYNFNCVPTRVERCAVMYSRLLKWVLVSQNILTCSSWKNSKIWNEFETFTDRKFENLSFLIFHVSRSTSACVFWRMTRNLSRGRR